LTPLKLRDALAEKATSLAWLKAARRIQRWFRWKIAIRLIHAETKRRREAAIVIQTYWKTLLYGTIKPTRLHNL